MSGVSAIEWTDATWNPVRGCSRVSEGCRNCYAERHAARFSGQGLDGSTPPKEYFTDDGMKYREMNPFWGFAERTKAGPRWTGNVELVPHLLDWPLRKRKPLRIFVNSMSDLFHEKLSNEAIAAVFGVMAACQQHTFQILTKRPERMQEWFAWVRKWSAITPLAFVQAAASDHLPAMAWQTSGWPLSNVWLGTSVENQATADERIPHLLAAPAAKRFVSYEPALGPVDFTHLDADAAGHPHFCQVNAFTGRHTDMGRPCEDVQALDWIIVGGESGPGARPFDLAWARSTVEQCKAAGVAVFIKQLGSGMSRHTNVGRGRHLVDGDREFIVRDRKGGDWSEWPEDLRVREFPKRWAL